jgi:hypothetical protein
MSVLRPVKFSWSERRNCHFRCNQLEAREQNTAFYSCRDRKRRPFTSRASVHLDACFGRDGAVRAIDNCQLCGAAISSTACSEIWLINRSPKVLFYISSGRGSSIQRMSIDSGEGGAFRGTPLASFCIIQPGAVLLSLSQTSM